MYGENRDSGLVFENLNWTYIQPKQGHSKINQPRSLSH